MVDLREPFRSLPRPPKGRLGITLIELMLTVAIVGIVGSIAARLMIQITRVYQVSTARVEIQRDARISMDLVSRKLHEARASTITIDQATDQPPYSRITFQTIEGSTVTYWQEGAKFHQQVNNNQGILTKNLRYLAFTYENTANDDIIAVSVTMEKDTYEGQTKALQLAVEKVRIMNE